MGRGRQKAKQTKVARELKYSTRDIDINRLQAELTHGDFVAGAAHATADPDFDPDAETDGDYDDDGHWAASGR